MGRKIKNRTEINIIEANRPMWGINKSKTWFSEKISQITINQKKEEMTWPKLAEIEIDITLDAKEI